MPDSLSVATSASATEPLRVVSVPRRPLEAREVRVKVAAIGVNPVDWKMRSGGPLRFLHRFVGPSGPLVVGVDFAGEVIEAAPDADLEVGARVVGGTDFSRGQLGSYATEVVVRDDQCALLPATVGFEAAACLPVPGATALRAFEVSKLSAGKRVLMLGASGAVGLATLELARPLGARVVGVCSTRNVALVTSLGATALDYTRGEVFKEAAAHGPYHLVFNAVGTDRYPLAACRPLLAPGGVIASIVVRGADVPAIAFDGRVKSILGRPNRKNLEPLVAALARGELTTRVEARFPLAEAEQAHRLSQGGKVVGKVLLLP